jgi:hypothetical protein
MIEWCIECIPKTMNLLVLFNFDTKERHVQLITVTVLPILLLLFTNSYIIVIHIIYLN